MTISNNPQQRRRNGSDGYWLVWFAAGCGMGTMLPHVMV